MFDFSTILYKMTINTQVVLNTFRNWLIKYYVYGTTTSFIISVYEKIVAAIRNSLIPCLTVITRTFIETIQIR